MSTNFHLLLAALLAMVVPLGLLITRSELQRYRTVVVEDLIAVAFKGSEGLPQIDLTLSRYKARSRISSTGQTYRSRQDAVNPYMGAVFFWLISFVGFLILFTPTNLLMAKTNALHPDLQISAFWGVLGTANDKANALKVIAVAGFGFLGGYIFQIGFLTRSALNLELGALSFVRASFRLLMGIIIAVIVYRGLGGAIDCFPPIDGSTNPCSTAMPVPTKAADPGQVVAGFGAALGVAFFTGYWPEGAISALSKRLRIRLKLVSQAALDQAEVIPVEVIDGIDSEASFRLQESNIYDVQNLAVANPIQLYAETPFGIFECFDWIMQAQLCLVVGPVAFHALKSHNIRTIFDLERAVLAAGAPEDYVRAIGSVILRNADDSFRASIGLGADGASCSVDPATIRHVVAIMGDDLHVNRLRALWSALTRSTTAGASPWLFETEWLPGETDRSLTPISSQAEADVADAVAAGARYRAATDAGADEATRIELRAACLAAVIRAARHGDGARARLRRVWNPKAPRKRAHEHGLEQFADDPDFARALA